MKLEIAAKAQRLATDLETGEVDEQRAIYYVEQMVGMTYLQRQQLEAVALREPKLDPQEVLLKSKRERQLTFRVTMGEKLYQALEGFVQEEGVTVNDAILAIVEAALNERGLF